MSHAQSRIPFQEFLAHLQNTYPPAFSDAAPLLHRVVCKSPDMRISTWKRWLLPLGLPKLAARGQLARPNVQASDVLLTFFPARTDYRELFVPVAAEIVERGARLAVALPPAGSVIDREFGGAPTFDLWSLASLQAFEWARKRYSDLRTAMRGFGAEWHLDAEAIAAVRYLFQGASWQAALMRSALERARPGAVLGVHFVENPGFIDAIRLAKAGRSAPTTFLLQHGVFSHAWGIHDFGGADTVLVWGTQARAELEAFPGAAFRSIVVGNPRLEWVAVGARPARRNDRAKVLVMGAFDTPARTEAFLSLVAEAVPETPHRRVVYRPHPSEPNLPYSALIEDGRLKLDQIDRSAPLYEAIVDADLVIGTTSTALPEALSLGVPVIQALPEVSGLDWHLKGMLAASTAAEMGRQVREVLEDPGVRETTLRNGQELAQSLFGESRGATERVADAVLSATEGFRAAVTA